MSLSMIAIWGKVKSAQVKKISIFKKTQLENITSTGMEKVVFWNDERKQLFRKSYITLRRSTTTFLLRLRSINNNQDKIRSIFKRPFRDLDYHPCPQKKKTKNYGNIWNTYNNFKKAKYNKKTFLRFHEYLSYELIILDTYLTCLWTFELLWFLYLWRNYE